jgi:PPM family protein phosphatase
MNFEYFAISDIGLVRSNNEDFWAQIPQKKFFILTDGMGGHNAGEVAAQETVAFLCDRIRELSIDPDEAIPTLISELQKEIEAANNHIYQLGQENPFYRGMGTTLCCALVHGDDLIYAHVGDSRIYRLRTSLEKLTTDHASTIEIKSNPPQYKNIITRSIGNKTSANPEIASTKILPGDLYFLCSDGLTDPVSDTMIENIITHSPTLAAACQKLVAVAKEKGGSDNITIVMFKFL